MNNVIIFGTTQFAELLYHYLSSNPDYNVCGFTVDQEFCTTSHYCNLPLIPFEEIENKFDPENYGMFICVGYTKMNSIRASRFEEAKRKGYKIMSYAHESATILTEDFGEGNIIMENVTIGAFSSIGNGNIFYPNAHVAHHTTIGNYNFFTISVAIAGNIIIGNNCFFGNNCTIKNNISIADYTLVGAAAYVSANTAAYSVYVPPRSICLINKKSTDLI